MIVLMEKIKANKLTVLLIAVVLFLLAGGVFAFQKITSPKTDQGPIQEVDLPFDPEGPYALLEPRRDGNALILNINRVSAYDGISYEMTYQSVSSSSEEGEGLIDRGVQGSVDTKTKKSEYSQEILFGTCSRGDTFSTLHCVFDKGVENGTLTMRIKKGNIVYKMNTLWHLQKPDVALGAITSADSHFVYTTGASREELTNVGYSIVNDLSGAPKLPQGKVVLGKIYAFNVPVAKTFSTGEVSIELADAPPADTKIARYSASKNEWEMLDTKINGSKLTAQASSNGIFAVLTPSE